MLMSVVGHSLPRHSAPVSNNVRYAPKATGRALMSVHQLSATFDTGTSCRIVVRGIYYLGLQHWKKTHNLLRRRSYLIWSGRRESNPRMQLGKLDGSQTYQLHSCKTKRIE